MEIINIEDCLIPSELKNIRLSKMYSISEVSEGTGLTSNMISRIENNNNVNFQAIITYADYLGYELCLKKKKKVMVIEI